MAEEFKGSHLADGAQSNNQNQSPLVLLNAQLAQLISDRETLWEKTGIPDDPDYLPVKTKEALLERIQVLEALEAKFSSNFAQRRPQEYECLQRCRASLAVLDSLLDVKEEKEEEDLPSNVPVVERLKKSLQETYKIHVHLKRLFDEGAVPIAKSFINLALIKESERKEKEKNLARGGVEEKDDGGEKIKSPAYVDERLASHEQLYVLKEPLELTELFEPRDDTPKPNKVLILGRAGIGKSILCQYLATQWASEEKGEMSDYLHEKFEAVFWIKLRELAADVTRATNLSIHQHIDATNAIVGEGGQIGDIYDRCTFVLGAQDTLVDVLDRFCLSGPKANRPTKKELAHYLDTNSDKVLFILDGFDEITDARHLDRILDELSTHPHLLLTSRPIVIETLGNKPAKFDRRLENMGFLNENIEAYVHQFMVEAEKPEEAPLMLDFLKSHAGVWGVAHIPINLELLSWLWSKGKLTFKQGQVITLSKLYQEIVDRVQGVYARKPLKQKNMSANNVNAFLECLAFSAMEEETLFISGVRAAFEKIFPQHNPSDEPYQEQLLKSATDKLGFLRTTGQGGACQLDQEHYFIHLSFQEFYAARYVARILSEQPNSEEATQILEQIRTEKYTPRYQLMLWMSAGLLYQRGKLTKAFSALENFWQAILSSPRDLIGYHHRDLVMRCLDECEADPRLPFHPVFMQQHPVWLKSDARYAYVDQLARCPLLSVSRPIVESFLWALKGQDRWVRSSAVTVLGKLNNASMEVVAALLEAVKDKEWGERHSVVEALGALNNPSGEVVGMLLEAVKNGDSELRNGAVNALGQLKNPNVEVITALLEAIKDKDEEWSVRNAAAKALGQLSQSSVDAVAGLLEMVKERNGFMTITGIQNPNNDVIAVLLRALKDKSKDVRWFAVFVLGQLNNSGNNIIAALLMMLEDQEEDVRCIAIQALCKPKGLNNDVIIALLGAVKDKSKYVRCAAVKALGQLNNPSVEVIAVLLGVLKDEDGDARRAAAEALAGLKEASIEVITALLGAVKDEYKYVRWHVAKALGNLKSASHDVITALLEAVKDEYKYVRWSAAEALGELDNASGEVIAALLMALEDKETDVRCAAVCALGNLKNLNNDVMAALLRAAKDENDGVRRRVVKTLGNLKSSSNDVIAVLLGAMKDKVSNVRYVAAEVLGQLSNSNMEVIAVLLGMVMDEDSDVRCAAVQALDQLHHPSVEVIVAMLGVVKDEDFGVRCNAARALLELSSQRYYLEMIFTNLTDFDMCVAYFEELFRQNYLLCIDHLKEQLIIRSGRETYYISLPAERLQYLEEKIIFVAKKRGYFLEEIGSPPIHLPVLASPAAAQTNNPAELLPHFMRKPTAIKTKVLAPLSEPVVSAPSARALSQQGLMKRGLQQAHQRLGQAVLALLAAIETQRRPDWHPEAHIDFTAAVVSAFLKDENGEGFAKLCPPPRRIPMSVSLCQFIKTYILKHPELQGLNADISFARQLKSKLLFKLDELYEQFDVPAPAHVEVVSDGGNGYGSGIKKLTVG